MADDNPPVKHCGICGVEYHRYGSTDRNHRPDAVACVNTLRWLICEIGRSSSGDGPTKGYRTVVLSPQVWAKVQRVTGDFD